MDQLIKELVSFLLDLNIYVSRSDTAEKILFDCAVEAIQYYWPVRSLTLITSTFFWLVKLSPLLRPPRDPNYTKRKSYSENDNISNEVDIDDSVNIGDGIDNKIFWVDRLPFTNPN